MTDILSFDPGMSTGLVRANVTSGSLPRLEEVSQIEGGLEGLEEAGVLNYLRQKTTVISELFSPRQMARSYRLEELEPLRIEGWLVAHREIIFRRPEQRHLFNRNDDNFKRSAAFLGWAGYWTTGSEVKLKDANDANSAMMHLFAYLRNQKHRPTIDLLLDFNRSNGKERND